MWELLFTGIVVCGLGLLGLPGFGVGVFGWFCWFLGFGGNFGFYAVFGYILMLAVGFWCLI